MSDISRVYLIPNVGKDEKLRVTNRTVEKLTSLGARVYISNTLKEYFIADSSVILMAEEEILREAECAVTLGGDGTILKCAEKIAASGIPLLGINLGRVGYMTHLEANELELLELLIKRKFRLDRRMMLKVQHYRRRNLITSQTALNDAVIIKGGLGGVVNIEMQCNGSRIISYHSDGVIISTPTGATAYSFSAGGPIIDPVTDLLMATPINPHSLFNRPIIFSGDSTLELHSQSRDAEIFLTLDGQGGIALGMEDSVRVTRSERNIYLISLKNDSFYHVLREKLTDR